MAWGKKKDEGVPVFTEDKKEAKKRRSAAKEAARKAGVEVTETKAGVGRPAKETDRQRRERQAREKINKHVARGGWTSPEYPVTPRGSKSEWD